jgi:biopolymer transport protein ExbD
MRYEAPPRRRSTGTVVLVVFLLGFMFLVGLAVVGFGVLLFARAESHQARAIRQRDIAIRHAEDARVHVEQARAKVEVVRERVAAEAADEQGSIRVADREIAIQLDEAGKIQVDGTACELPQLKDTLASAGQGRENAIIVIVKADKRCLFEPVAGVLAVCKELGFAHVRIAALGD